MLGRRWIGAGLASSLATRAVGLVGLIQGIERGERLQAVVGRNASLVVGAGCFL